MKKQVSVAYMTCGLAFTVSLIIANIVSQKLVRVSGFDFTAGIIVFPLTYILNDIIAEVWGYRKMRLVIWMGFLMNFLTILIFRLTIWAPSSPHFFNQDSFKLILSSSERITIASFIAFMFGSFINAYIMSKMKIHQHGRHFGIRATVSTIFGEGADSLVFCTIAFMGVVRNRHLLVMIFTQVIFKTLYEIVLLPITIYLVKHVKKHEHKEILDYGISYNPFKLKDI
ncbi:MAG: queuosine precursor transporter [Paludibacter sp.]